MYRFLFLLLCLSSVTISAQSTVLDETAVFDLIKANPDGGKASYGDYFKFHATMLTQTDSILFSTKETEAPQMVKRDTTNTNEAPIISALELMRVGEIGRVTVSLDAFPQKLPGMENDTVLFYDVELLEIISKAEYDAMKLEEAKRAEEAQAILKAREEEVLAFHAKNLTDYRAKTLVPTDTTASGLRYIIHEVGEGAVPLKGENIAVNYIGTLAEGATEPFDQSFGRGEPITFKVDVGQVIPGWDEGLLLLPRGSKATLFIPADLAYGDEGAGTVIPGGAELVFYIELVDK